MTESRGRSYMALQAINSSVVRMGITIQYPIDRPMQIRPIFTE